MGQPGQCQTGTRGWNQWVEGRKLWELFQTRDCEGCNFVLFSVGDCGNTPSLGSTWLRDLPKVHSWPQGSFRRQNIAAPPDSVRQIQPSGGGESCEVQVTCTSRWNAHFYCHCSHSRTTAIMEWFFSSLVWTRSLPWLSREPELNMTLTEGISEGLTKGRPTPVDLALEKFLDFFLSFWEFFHRKKKKKKVALTIV